MNTCCNRTGVPYCASLKGQVKRYARKWGHVIARGWATLLLDRLRDFVVPPSSVGGNSSSLDDSQGVDELATSDRYHHFHGHSGLCA